MLRGETSWHLADLTPRHDLDSASLVPAVIDFFKRAEPGETLLFYFAGHGITQGGKGYLLPVDYAPGGALDRALSADVLWALSASRGCPASSSSSTPADRAGSSCRRTASAASTSRRRARRVRRWASSRLRAPSPPGAVGARGGIAGRGGHRSRRPGRHAGRRPGLRKRAQSLRVRVRFPAGNHQSEPLLDPLPPLPCGHRGDRTEIAVPIETLERGKTYGVEIEPCTAGKECGAKPAEYFDVAL